MRSAAVLLTVLCLLTPSGCGRRAQDRKLLKFAHGLQLDHPYHLMAVKFREELERRAPQFEVQIFPAGQLGNERTLIENVQLGMVDVTTITSALTANFVPEFKVFSLPFLFRGPQHLFHVMDSDLGEELALKMETKGLVRLGYAYGGARDLYGSVPMRDLKELQGRKIRTMQNPILIATWNKLGAIATPIAFSDLYMSLKQGVVEGGEGTGLTYRSMKFFDCSPHYTRIQYVYSWHNFMMSQRTWLRLNPEEQTAVREAAAAAIAFEREEFIRQEKALFDELRTKYNVKVYVATDGPEWAKRTEAIYAKYADKVGGMDLINRIRNIR